MKRIKASIVFYFLVALGVLAFLIFGGFFDFTLAEGEGIFSEQAMVKNFGLSITCLVLLLVAEWICIIAIRHPFFFLGKLKKKKEFIKLVDKTAIKGNTYSDLKQVIQERNYKDKAKDEWGISTSTDDGFLKLNAYLRIGTFTEKMRFFRNRCNNLRSVVLFVLFLFVMFTFGIVNPDLEILLEYGWILPVAYCVAMWRLVYIKDDCANYHFEVCKTVTACANCKTITDFNQKREYERADFLGDNVKYHTTYKDDYKGSIDVGDLSISVYGKKADETTVTAYGYETKYYTCPYCGHTVQKGSSVEEKKTYRW